MSEYKLTHVWKTDLTTGETVLTSNALESPTLYSYFAAIARLNKAIKEDKFYYEPTHEALKLLKYMEIKTFNIARRAHHDCLK